MLTTPSYLRLRSPLRVPEASSAYLCPLPHQAQHAVPGLSILPAGGDGGQLEPVLLFQEPSDSIPLLNLLSRTPTGSILGESEATHLKLGKWEKPL